MSTSMVKAGWLIISFIVLLSFLWFGRHVLLLVFAALLIALILTSLTQLVRKVVPVGHKVGFGIALALIAAIISAAVLLVFPSVSGQFAELADRVPKLWADFRKSVESSSIYEKVEGNLPDVEDMVPSGGAGKITGVFSSTFETLSSFVFILFTALFLAVSPGLYRHMFKTLFPPQSRERVDGTVSRSICTLKYWLLGQAVSMSVVGLITGIALAIAGVPFAAALGIVAGIAEFIPLVGPLLASIPALLLGLSEGTNTFFIVLGIVLGVQFLEGNLIMPLVQRHAVDLPPVVTLVALLLLGGAFGLLGMFVAAPLAAVAIVLIEDLYLRDYLKTDDKLSP